mmetsp:Transcript_63955/g.151276  ORF Transcript_63955/g.151276 Transcript_63955/m.151276 type:complete len:313 (-) Transcript_63955:489-1427(-)
MELTRDTSCCHVFVRNQIELGDPAVGCVWRMYTHDGSGSSRVVLSPSLPTSLARVPRDKRRTNPFILSSVGWSAESTERRLSPSAAASNTISHSPSVQCGSRVGWRLCTVIESRAKPDADTRIPHPDTCTSPLCHLASGVFGESEVKSMRKDCPTSSPSSLTFSPSGTGTAASASPATCTISHTCSVCTPTSDVPASAGSSPAWATARTSSWRAVSRAPSSPPLSVDVVLPNSSSSALKRATALFNFALSPRQAFLSCRSFSNAASFACASAAAAARACFAWSASARASATCCKSPDTLSSILAFSACNFSP